jgi:hypothetical protein
MQNTYSRSEAKKWLHLNGNEKKRRIHIKDTECKINFQVSNTKTDDSTMAHIPSLSLNYKIIMGVTLK